MENLLNKLKNDSKLKEDLRAAVEAETAKVKKDSGEAEVRLDYLLKLALEDVAKKNNIALENTELSKAHLEWLAVNFIKTTPNKLDDKLLNLIGEKKA